MGQIVSVTNQKGGVGKTTTAVNLSAALASKGRKVLLVDCDPQGNATTGLGIDKRKQGLNTTYQLLIGAVDDVKDCIIEIYENLSLIPANEHLSGTEVELIGIDKNWYILKPELDKIKGNYDFIIIDCLPSLSILTINAMVAADSILIPIQCEYYAMEGLAHLMKSVNLIKKKINPSLDINGILFTMYDTRTNLSKEVVETIKKNINFYTYETVIPRNVRLAEAPSHGMTIFQYDPCSIGAERYSEMAAEFIKRSKSL